MTTMTLDQAKDHLADLLAKAAAGEEVVIVRDDGSAFTVVPTQAPRKKRGFVGSLEGKTSIADDVDSTKGESDPDATPTQRRPRRESFGVLKGKIWMAPDFDDIPEGFEPYLGDDDVKGE